MTAEPADPGGSKRKEAFPRSLRLRTRREFLRVQDRGRKVVVGPLLALALPNEQGVTRIGLTVSTKVGNAVTRVRIRRMLRELFRKRRDQLPPSIDLVMIARASAAEADFAQMEGAFDAVARKLDRAPESFEGVYRTADAAIWLVRESAGGDRAPRIGSRPRTPGSPGRRARSARGRLPSARSQRRFRIA